MQKISFFTCQACGDDWEIHGINLEDDTCPNCGSLTLESSLRFKEETEAFYATTAYGIG